jgi:hypothetical protein
MTTKNRIAKLETNAKRGCCKKIIFIVDDMDGGGATVDGIHMTAQEAESKAAELSKQTDVTIIHVCYESEPEPK